MLVKLDPKGQGNKDTDSVPSLYSYAKTLCTVDASPNGLRDRVLIIVKQWTRRTKGYNFEWCEVDTPVLEAFISFRQLSFHNLVQ